MLLTNLVEKRTLV